MELLKKNNTKLWFFGCFLLVGMLIVSVLSLHGQALDLPEATTDGGNKAWGGKIKFQLNVPSDYKYGNGKADDGKNLYYFDILEEQDINKKDFTMEFTLSGYQMDGAENYEYKQAFVDNPVGVKDHIVVYDDAALTNKQSLSFELTAGFEIGNTNAPPWVNLTFPSGSLENDKDYYVVFEPEMYATDSAYPLRWYLVYHFKTAAPPAVDYSWQGSDKVQILWTEPSSSYISTESTEAQEDQSGFKYYYNECSNGFCPGKDQTFSFDVKGQGADHIGKEGKEPPANHIFIYSDRSLSDDSLIASAANERITSVSRDEGKAGGGTNISFIVPKNTLEDGKTYYLVIDEKLETNASDRITGAKIITKISAKHDDIQNVPDKPNTCTEDGWTGRTQCETCGSIIDEGILNPATGHYTFNPKQKVATCTEDGWRDVQICDRCGETYGEYTVIPALGHLPTVTEKIEPTCTESGRTEGTYCPQCNTWLEPYETIPAKGHTEVALGEAKEATCTESGMTAGKKCAVCGDIIENQKEIPPLGHQKADPVKENEVAATCTKEGSYEEVVYCSECKAEMSRETKTVDALGHDEKVSKEAKAATCTEDGWTEETKCSRCDEVIKESTVIKAKGHTEEEVKGKAATCTEKGLTDGKKCSVCGEVLEAQKDIPALGHDYKDGKCTVCGAVDPDYKPTPEEPEDTNLVVKTVDGKQIAVRGTKSTTKAEDYTGIAPEVNNRKVWWRVVDGDVVPHATGVFKNEYGWWRVENGTVNFNAQGIYKNEYGWWKTKNGKVTFDETGVFKNEYGWWRVEKSKVNFKADGIYKNDYGWWKTTDGKVTFKENGVFRNEYGWWKVEKSKVNFKFTGIAKNEYGTWYVKNGKVDFSKNGTVTYAGKAYTVTNGKAKLA